VGIGNSPRELLALRKDLLVARAALQRLRVRRDTDALRESLRWPRAATAFATSPRGLSITFALLLAVAGRGRLARLVRAAATLVALARLAYALGGGKPAGEQHRDSGAAAREAERSSV
jgi:hypothetical protein